MDSLGLPRPRSTDLDGLYPYGYIQPVKPVRFVGNSLKCLREFPDDARHDAGYQLDKIQRGGQADDVKPMPAIGRGVEEIRVWNGGHFSCHLHSASCRCCVRAARVPEEDPSDAT